MFYLYLLIAFTLGGMFYLLRRKSVIALTVTDFAVFGFLLYSLLYIGVVQKFECDPLVWFRWGAVALCYLFFRNLKKVRMVLYGLMLYGLFQSVVAIGQSLLLFQSTNHFFSVTGTIGNPGPLGGFLAITLVCAIGMLRATHLQRRTHWLLLGLAACVLFVTLLLTDSRAAVLSLLVGVAIIWSDRIWKLFKRHKLATLTTFSIAAILLCSFFYFYRPVSAHARMLIWRVSAAMIAEKPLFGHGVGAFNQKYMLYQAAYFERNPQSSLIMVADNAAYPYNELIHVVVEQGAIGGCLLLAVFIIGLAFRSSDMLNHILKAGLVSFTVFSCFSYPAEVVELLLLPAILLGTMQGKVVCSLPVRRWMKTAGIGSLAGIAFLSVASIVTCRKISDEVRQLAASKVAIPTPYCDRYFSILKYNPNFNLSYLPVLCRLPCQADSWQKVKHIFPSSETFCLLGKAKERCEQDECVEQLYQVAANMVPTRISPNYHLWKLYVKRGDCVQARCMAQKIFSQSLKVENTFTLQVKGEMKRYLENYKL